MLSPQISAGCRLTADCRVNVGARRERGFGGVCARGERESGGQVAVCF